MIQKYVYMRGNKAKCMSFLKNRGSFHDAWGNVNYTEQCPFHISLNVHARTGLRWVTVSCYSNLKIHLGLLDNEDRMERLPLQLSRTAGASAAAENLTQLVDCVCSFCNRSPSQVALRGQVSHGSHGGAICFFKQ